MSELALVYDAAGRFVGTRAVAAGSVGAVSGSVRELSERFGVHPRTLQASLVKADWATFEGQGRYTVDGRVAARGIDRFGHPLGDDGESVLRSTEVTSPRRGASTIPFGTSMDELQRIQTTPAGAADDSPRPWNHDGRFSF